MLKRNRREDAAKAGEDADGDAAPLKTQARRSSAGDHDVKSHPMLFSTRMTMAFVLFLGFVLLYSMRVNLSVGMVCMVNHTAIRDLDSPPVNSSTAPRTTRKSKHDTCSRYFDNSTDVIVDGEMVWSKKLQGMALSAFFWGYIVTQVPGGWLAARYGAKIVLLVSLGLGSIFTLLMPVAARLHYAVFVALRVLLGVLHGTVFPAAHVLWSQWAPPGEKSRLVGFAYAGSQIGNVITMPLSGLLCTYGFDGGWPSVFYLFGLAGVVWTVLWGVFGASTPHQHRCISSRESDYIEMTLDGQVSTKAPPTPWLRIFTSMPVWAITVANMTSDFGIYVFLTNLPTYMKENLGFSAETSGLVSALPYIGFWGVMNVSAFIADTLIERRVWSTTVVRKVLNGIGQITSAAALIILTMLGCGAVWVAVALLTVGVSSCGAMYGAGFLVNHPELAPQFSGILMGISNAAGTLSGMVGPALIGVMTEQQTAQEWRNVFYLTAGIMVFGAVFYGLFASGEIQDWAMERKEQAVTVDDNDEIMEAAEV